LVRDVERLQLMRVSNTLRTAVGTVAYSTLVAAFSTHNLHCNMLHGWALARFNYFSIICSISFLTENLNQLQELLILSMVLFMRKMVTFSKNVAWLIRKGAAFTFPS
jgi:hypothetical protein